LLYQQNGHIPSGVCPLFFISDYSTQVRVQAKQESTTAVPELLYPGSDTPKWHFPQENDTVHGSTGTHSLWNRSKFGFPKKANCVTLGW
jgi:hypothetical protein